jgi:diguanylate cyclase (GGDEF)-like protein
MFFGRRAAKAEPTSPRSAHDTPTSPSASRGTGESSAAISSIELDAADTVGAVLRAMAQKALLPGEDPAIADCERWAQHVLVAAPSPSGRADGDPRRDWGGVRRFLLQLRSREHADVTRALRLLRELVWEVVRFLGGAFVGDRELESNLRKHMERLRRAAESSDPDELRREALGVAHAIGTLADTRSKVQSSRLGELAAKIRALSEELEEARREGQEDALTKLFNRRAFDEYVERVTALDGLCGKPACLVMVDVDHFKRINDTFGHPAGDVVLTRVADALMRTFMRKCDFVARYGGEEFAVIVRDTDLAGARLLVDRFVSYVRGIPVAENARDWTLTVSCGISSLAAGDKPLDWIARADRALYEAKSAGRDRYVYVDAA